MIRSPLQGKELGGLALQMKIMADLMQMHKQFNEGIAKLAEITKATHDHANKTAEHAARIERLPAGQKGDKGDMPDVDYDRIIQEVRHLIPTPKDGADANLNLIVAQVLEQIPTPRNGRDAVVDHEKLADLVTDRIVTGKKLKVEHVGGLRGEIDSYRAQLAGKAYGKDTWARGGGDTVAAGTGVTITTNSSGNKVISATGGGAGFQVPTGTIDGVNQTFVFAVAPNAICVDNGRAMQKVSGDGSINWTGTTTVVLSVAPTFDVFGLS